MYPGLFAIGREGDQRFLIRVRARVRASVRFSREVGWMISYAPQVCMLSVMCPAKIDHGSRTCR